MKIINRASFLAFFSLAIVACGDGQPTGQPGSHVDPGGPDASAIYCNRVPVPPGCYEDDGGGDPPPPPQVTLRLRLRNLTSETRGCSDVSASTTNLYGALVTTSLAAGGTVAPGGEVVGSMSFPQGTLVGTSGGCWRLGYPTQEYVHGSFHVTMTGNQDCTMYYSVNDGIAHEYMQCVSF